MLSDSILNETIRSLETFTQHIAEDVRQGPSSTQHLLRKEALLGARVLLSKLRLVRSFDTPTSPDQLVDRGLD